MWTCFRRLILTWSKKSPLDCWSLGCYPSLIKRHYHSLSSQRPLHAVKPCYKQVTAWDHKIWAVDRHEADPEFTKQRLRLLRRKFLVQKGTSVYRIGAKVWIKRAEEEQNAIFPLLECCTLTAPSSGISKEISWTSQSPKVPCCSGSRWRMHTNRTNNMQDTWHRKTSMSTATEVGLLLFGYRSCQSRPGCLHWQTTRVSHWILLQTHSFRPEHAISSLVPPLSTVRSPLMRVDLCLR